MRQRLSIERLGRRASIVMDSGTAAKEWSGFDLAWTETRSVASAILDQRSP
jgi:hypothetical protein